jgi:hypothetical protein
MAQKPSGRELVPPNLNSLDWDKEADQDVKKGVFDFVIPSEARNLSLSFYA